VRSLQPRTFSTIRGSGWPRLNSVSSGVTDIKLLLIEHQGDRLKSESHQTLVNHPEERPPYKIPIYDLKRGKIYFRTLQNPQIRIVDTRSFDYSCGTPVKIFDMNANEAGDVTAKFGGYTRRANRELIDRSFSGTSFLKDIPPRARCMIAAYPESFTCAAAQ
jgi:hypothetical protein